MSLNPFTQVYVSNVRKAFYAGIVDYVLIPLLRSMFQTRNKWSVSTNIITAS